MPRLWIDTNAARSANGLRKLVRLAREKGVEIVIHPQVYLERRRQERVKQGEAFSAFRFDDFLTQLGLKVHPFVLDQPTAATWADELYRRYPTDDDWERAKQRTLGGELKAHFKVEPGHMPMTTDWIISLEIECDPSSCVLTHDDGEEWTFLRAANPPRVLDWDGALVWLASLPPATPS